MHLTRIYFMYLIRKNRTFEVVEKYKNKKNLKQISSSYSFRTVKYRNGVKWNKKQLMRSCKMNELTVKFHYKKNHSFIQRNSNGINITILKLALLSILLDPLMLLLLLLLLKLFIFIRTKPALNLIWFGYRKWDHFESWFLVWTQRTLLYASI